MIIARLAPTVAVRAMLGALVLVAGCEGHGEVSRVDSITPTRPAALAGAPTVVDVAIASECWKSCQETARPILELDSGAPLPSSLRYELAPDIIGYFIANPGSTCSWLCGPSACPGWTYSAWSWAEDVFANCKSEQGIKGFSIRLVADPATAPTSFKLRLRIPDCGGELLAPFTLDLVGSVPAPGMCAASTGAPCSTDAGCSAGPDCFETCAATNEASSVCSGFGAVSAGPDGSECGCVVGICSWH